MSEKVLFILAHDEARRRAVKAIAEAPAGWHVNLRPPTRSTTQNALMWSLLADVSRQVVWYGKRLTSEEWKHVFSAAHKGQTTVPGVDGNFVVLGQSTSQMTVKEMSDLIEIIRAFGAERSVMWTDPVAVYA